MEKAKKIKVKIEENQLRSFCRFFMHMQRKLVYDMEQKRYVMDNGAVTSLEPEFYATLCQVTETLSAKMADHASIVL